MNVQITKRKRESYIESFFLSLLRLFYKDDAAQIGKI